tara:strand:+ start:422 stop:709 length:288 start_codon:yes stop_codon:yes gene_type:complete
MARHKMLNGNRVWLTAEEETARNEEERIWSEGAFDRAMVHLRRERNHLLSETDFYALQDVSMTQDMTNYRQALRDLPSGLTTVEEVKAVTYPTKP